MQELKPCPFCGGEAEYFDDGLSVHVRCTECEIAGNEAGYAAAYAAFDLAAKNWNQRVEPERKDTGRDPLEDIDKWALIQRLSEFRGVNVKDTLTAIDGTQHTFITVTEKREPKCKS